MNPYIFHVDPPSIADPGDELSIQIALRKRLKGTGIKFVAVPNGAQRTVWAGMKAKAEGMAKGFPDAVLMWKPGGIAIAEIKARSGTLSEDQHIWLNWLHSAGFDVGVFRSVDSCLAWLRHLGAPIDGASASRNSPTHLQVIRSLLAVAMGASTKTERDDAIEMAHAFVAKMP